MNEKSSKWTLSRVRSFWSTLTNQAHPSSLSFLSQRGLTGVAAVVVLTNPGYLPKIGPSPLRVLARISPETNIVRHVEAPPSKPVEPAVEAEVTPPPTQATNAAPVLTAISATPPVTGTPTNSIPSEAPADQVISPQAFLKYFNSTAAVSTNQSVNFTPPGAAGPPGSTSTFLVSPP